MAVYGQGMAEKDTSKTDLEAVYDKAIALVDDSLGLMKANGVTSVGDAKTLAGLILALNRVSTRTREEDAEAPQATLPMPALSAADMAHLPDITPPGSTGSTE